MDKAVGWWLIFFLGWTRILGSQIPFSEPTARKPSSSCPTIWRFPIRSWAASWKELSNGEESLGREGRWVLWRGCVCGSCLLLSFLTSIFTTLTVISIAQTSMLCDCFSQLKRGGMIRRFLGHSTLIFPWKYWLCKLCEDNEYERS